MLPIPWGVLTLKSLAEALSIFFRLQINSIVKPTLILYDIDKIGRYFLNVMLVKKLTVTFVESQLKNGLIELLWSAGIKNFQWWSHVNKKKIMSSQINIRNQSFLVSSKWSASQDNFHSQICLTFLWKVVSISKLASLYNIFQHRLHGWLIQNDSTNQIGYWLMP